jgi:hypothetical protein
MFFCLLQTYLVREYIPKLQGGNKYSLIFHQPQTDHKKSFKTQ